MTKKSPTEGAKPLDSSWINPSSHIEHWSNFYKPNHFSEFKRSLELSKPSAVVLLGGGYAGNVNWQSRFNIRPYPDKILAPLLKRIEICRELDIKIILVMSGIGNRRAGTLHPEWIRLDSSFNPSKENQCGYQMDPLSPYLDKWFLPQLREALAPPYNADALWVDTDCWYFKPSYSEATIARFRELHGELPVPLISDETLNQTQILPSNLDPARDLAIEKWMILNRKIFREWQEKIASTCHEFGALYCGNASYHPDAGPEAPPRYIDFLSHDIPPFPYSGCTKSSFKARGLDPLGKPFDIKIWNLTSLQSWGGYFPYPKGAQQHQCEVASLIANGGTFCHWNSTNSIKPAMPIIKMIRARKPLLINTTSLAEIALLNTPESYYANSNQLMWAKAANTPLWGLSRALQLGGFDFNIINQDSFDKKLSQFKIVILARQTHITKKTRRLLEVFVSEGGTLICGIKSFNPELSRLLGIDPKIKPLSNKFLQLEIEPSSIQASPQGEGICTLNMHEIEYQVELEGATSIQNYLKDSDIDPKGLNSTSGWTTRAIQTNKPFLTMNRFGKGKAYLITCDIFANYQNNLYFGLKNLILSIVDRAYPSPLIRARAQRYVEVSLRDQPSQNRKILHLINLNISSFNNSVETQYEHSIDTGPIEVTIKRPGENYWDLYHYFGEVTGSKLVTNYYETQTHTTYRINPVSTMESFILVEDAR